MHARPILAQLALTFALMFGVLAAPFSIATLASAQAPSEEARAESRRHFDRGVQLFMNGNNEGALIEFEAANAAAANFRILYNVGNVHAALRHAVEAVEAYEKYLWEGGDAIPAARRAEVEAALVEQRANIGTVMVTSNVESATITINGVDTEHTVPLADPLRLSIGQYAITLTKPGWAAPAPQVTVSSGSAQSIEIRMTELAHRQGNLSVSAAVPDVEVLVDGRSVGTTPLEDVVLEPGDHEVVGRRAGYVSAREHAMIEDGGRSSIAFAMERDPNARDEDLGALALTLPAGSATLRVDGELVSLAGGRTTLPVGRHYVQLDVEDRQTFETRVAVPAEGELALSPELLWTPEVRLDKLQEMNFRTTLGAIIGIGGVATALVGASVLIWNEARDNRSELEADYIRCTMTGMECGGERTERANQYVTLDGQVPAFRLYGMIPLGIGVVASVVGAILYFTAPTTDEIDAEAHAEGFHIQVVPGLGDVSVVGTF